MSEGNGKPLAPIEPVALSTATEAPAPPLASFIGRTKINYRATVGLYGHHSWHYGIQEGEFSWYDIPKMRKDPQVRICLRVIRGPLDSVKFKIKAKNPAVTETVVKTLKKFWQNDLGKAIKMVEWGAACAAVNYNYDQETGQVEYVDLQEFSILDARPLQINGDMVGLSVTGLSIDLSGMMQGTNVANPMNPQRLFSPRYIWFSNEPEFGSFYGRSRYEGAWAPWMEKRGKKGAIDTRRLWYFKNAFQGGMMWVPPGSMETETGVVSNLDYAREVLEKMETGGLMVVPGQMDDKGNRYWEHKAGTINGDGEQFLAYPKDLDAEITKGMEIPPEVIESQEGAGGLGHKPTVPWIVFLTGEDGIAKSILAAFVKHVLKPVVKFNHGDDEDFEVEAVSLLPKDEPQQPGQGQPGQPGQEPPQPGQQPPGQPGQDAGMPGTAGAAAPAPPGGGMGAAMSYGDAIAAAALDVDTDPSEEQKAAGNYRKGHVTVQGLRLTIENPKGSVRRGCSKSGKEWSQKMAAHYGYIKRTESEADGDHVDVFIGPNPESEIVFVVDQVRPDGSFDEHKCMLGYTCADEAKEAYHANYSKGWTGFGGMKSLTMPTFQAWACNGDTGRPICNQSPVSLSAIPAPLRAPKGHGKANPLFIGGKQFTSGEFIPHEALANATHEEKAKLHAAIAAENGQQGGVHDHPAVKAAQAAHDEFVAKHRGLDVDPDVADIIRTKTERLRQAIENAKARAVESPNRDRYTIGDTVSYKGKQYEVGWATPGGMLKLKDLTTNERLGFQVHPSDLDHDAPAGAVHAGHETTIPTPSGESIKARYEVRELADVTGSNRVLPGGGFQDMVAAGKYPRELQPRNYNENPAEQAKVLRLASHLVPAYLVSEHPDATSGPPIINQSGHVLSGNGRNMALEMARNLGKLDAYRAYLNEKAGQFGIDPEQLKGMREPVLYRVVDMEGQAAANFARAANIAPTQSQGVGETAAALSNLIPGDIAEQLNLGPDTTFSQAVTGPGGKAFRDRLLSALRTTAPTMESDLFENDGKLTDKGTEFVRQMLLTKFLPPGLIRSLGEQRRQLMNGIEAATPQLLLLQRGQGGVNIAPQMREALDVFSRNADMKTPADVDAVVAQGSLYGGMQEPISPAARMMLDFLVANRDTPSKLRKGLVELAGSLHMKSGGLFTDQMGDTGELSAEALGVTHRPGAKFGHDQEIEHERQAAIKAGHPADAAESAILAGEAAGHAEGAAAAHEPVAADAPQAQGGGTAGAASEPGIAPAISPVESRPDEPGFTGTTTDSLGRVYYWKDGVRVRGPRKPTEPKPEATPDAAPEENAPKRKIDKNRVTVDGVPYHRVGKDWINQNDPDSRATSSLMDKWRLKGRVQEVYHGDENEQLEGQGAEGDQGRVHSGELAGDARSGDAREPSGDGEGVRGGLPALPDSDGGAGAGPSTNVTGPGDGAASGAGDGAARTDEPRRVSVGGDVYRQEGGQWVNEAKPEYRASESTMNRWRQKGRVQNITGGAGPASAENPTDTKTAANFRYADRNFLQHGDKAKFNANIEAIKTLAAMKAEGRTEPTVEEQQILSRYVGWGQFPGVFNSYGDQGYSHIVSEKWKKERAQLRELISEEEWEAARSSTKNAHFTDPSIVDAHWKMAQRLGFKGGRFLETSAGTGYYLGMMPGDLAGKTKATAVEQDSLSAQILAALYPASKTYHQGFEDHQAPDNFYDLVASNVPFGNYTVHDKRYNKYAAKIHDYFFLKSADLTKAGGLIMHITSTGTLDKPEDKIRQALAAQCDLVGAIRFPKQAHKEGAGTDVVTDLVILRKRHPGEKPVTTDETPVEAMPSIEQDTEAGFTGITTDSLGRLYHWKDGKRVPGPNWMDVTTVPDPAGGEPITVNKYFAEHPEQILGHMDRTGTMRGGDEKSVSKVSAEELTNALGQEVRFVRRKDDEDEDTEEATKHGSFLFADGSRVPAEDIDRVANEGYQKKLAAAIDRLPQDVAKTSAKPKGAFEPEKMPAPGDVKEGGFSIQNGKLFVREGGALVEHAPLPKDGLEHIKGLMEVRDAVRATLNAQLQGQDATEARTELNRVYDEFTGKYGILNHKSHKHLYGDDPDYPVLLATEKYDPKTKKATKADIFFKDTIRAAKKVEKAGSIGEALGVSLHETGTVDVERMAALTGRDQSSVAAELVQSGLAFQDPSAGWMPADLYLSGNVRKKLALAKAAAATDHTFDANVAALEKVQPDDVPHTEITVKMGAPWLPTSDMRAFASELLDVKHGAFEITRNPATGDWHAGYNGERGRSLILQSQLAQKWGTKRKDFRELLDAALNSRTVIVKDEVSDGSGGTKEVVNKDETDAAQGKIQDIKDAFRDWIWKDDTRRERLARFYNDNFNNIRPIHYNGSHQTFPGMNPSFKMRQLQENFVWQVVTTGRGLAGHEVGTGKTASMIAAAMELRRLGLAKKPAIACLKANVEQITREARDLYPGAKILSMANMFDAAKRKKTMSQIATGDYDMVIVSHDNLNMMKMLPETEAKYIRAEIDELTAAKLAYEAEQGGAKKGDRIVKALETAKENLEAKLKTALAGGRKDNQLYFEESGIDQLFVDEAHNYKSLPVYTKMQRVKGIPTNRSQRATSMLMRTRWLMENNNGRGVVMATGTPVANTMGELYNMQRYLQPDELKERGIKTFDDWANVFGEMNTKMEFTVAGEYKPVTRFAEFVNLPELMQISGQTIDIQRVENLPPVKMPDGTMRAAIVRPHRHDKVVAAPHSDSMQRLMDSLKERAMKVKQRHGPPMKGDDNMLTICTDGRKGAIDMRLLDPNAPDDPNSKVNMAVRNILEIAKAKPGMAQLLFSDVGVHPVKAAKVKVKGAKGDELSIPDDEPEGDEDAAERDSVMAGNGKFHLYQNIIDKLVTGGIPREKIADFSTLSGVKKEEAAAGLRDGSILVGIGGTKKLGTGMNVQTRLAALHHLDVPWLPADVEQRDGRGWRSGNKNEHLDVFRYVSEGSLDQTFWQIVGNKAKFINQVMNGKAGTRSVKDEDSEVLTPDQLMAAASGDPRILEKVNLDEDVRNLQSAERRHATEQTRMKDQIRKGKDVITELHHRAKKMHDLAAIVESHLQANPEFSITIGDKTFADRKEATEVLKAETAKPRGEMTSYGYWRTREEKLGHYRGLDIMMSGQKVFLRSPDGVDVPTGEGLGSIEYITRKLPEAAGTVETQAKKTAADLETIGASIGKPFPKAADLEAKRARLKDLAAQLKASYQTEEDKEQQAPAEPAAMSHDVSTEPRDDHGRWTVGQTVKVKGLGYARRSKIAEIDEKPAGKTMFWLKDGGGFYGHELELDESMKPKDRPAEKDKWTEDYFAPGAEQGSLFGNDVAPMPEAPVEIPQEKIGRTRIMGEDMTHAEGQEVDGVVFDRFETDTGGAVRMTDVDSGSVFNLTKYPTLDALRAGYADLVSKARKMSGEVELAPPSITEDEQPAAMSAGWDEAKHHRGQPGNPGQFGAGGAGAAAPQGQQGKPAAAQKPPAPAPSVQANVQRPQGAAQQNHPITSDDVAAPPPPGGYTPDVTEDANGDGVADFARVGVPAFDVPPPPKIGLLPNLTPHERTVERGFIKQLEDDPEGCTHDFLSHVLHSTKPGEAPTFETDAAKLLADAWTVADQGERSQNRATLNTPLHQTANAICKRAFLKHLDTLKAGDELLVTCGGCGSGKGFALGNIPQALAIKQRSKAVWDSAGDQNATENPWIQHEAEKRGLKVNYLHVHANPRTQWADPERGVVKRAADPKDGRMVGAKVFADSYAHGARNMQAFHDKHKNNPHASFMFLENAGAGVINELPGIKPEALNIDADELAAYAMDVVAKGDAPEHVKRGALMDARIWGAKAQAPAPQAKPAAPKPAAAPVQKATKPEHLEKIGQEAIAEMRESIAKHKGKKGVDRMTASMSAHIKRLEQATEGVTDKALLKAANEVRQRIGAFARAEI